MERVVPNALAKETRLCRLISAPSANNLHIVFENRSTVRVASRTPKIFKNILYFCREGVREITLIQS